MCACSGCTKYIKGGVIRYVHRYVGLPCVALLCLLFLIMLLKRGRGCFCILFSNKVLLFVIMREGEKGW